MSLDATLRLLTKASGLTAADLAAAIPRAGVSTVKAWLAGEMDGAQLVMRAPEMLARKQIELRTEVKVASIDRAARQVLLADGSALPYSGLVLATGSTPRSLPLPGGNAAGVHALRSREDADAIAQRLALCLQQQRPVVVIGGGLTAIDTATANAATAALRRKRDIDDPPSAVIMRPLLNTVRPFRVRARCRRGSF